MKSLKFSINSIFLLLTIISCSNENDGYDNKEAEEQIRSVVKKIENEANLTTNQRKIYTGRIEKNGQSRRNK